MLKHMEIIFIIVFVLAAVGLLVALFEWRRGAPFGIKTEESPAQNPFLTGEAMRARPSGSDQTELDETVD